MPSPPAHRGRPRRLDDWGALSAWAWGASRVVDALKADPNVDASRIAIFGHSRYGKAALVAMAYDDRFKAGFISSSGAGGAAPYRRHWGEQVENVAAAKIALTTAEVVALDAAFPPGAARGTRYHAHGMTQVGL